MILSSQKDQLHINVGVADSPAPTIANISFQNRFND